MISIAFVVRRLVGWLGVVGLAAVSACASASPEDTIADFRGTARALAQAAEASGTVAVAGRNGWLFLAPELRHASLGAFWGPRAAEISRARRPDAADPFAAIVDFNERLEAVGVELLLVPVPPKSIVYPGMVSAGVVTASPTQRLDPDHQVFYTLLRDAGVDVLDLTDGFLQNRDHPDGPVYCRRDTHWSGVGCVLAGRAIAAAVRGRSWYPDLARENHEARWRDATIVGDLTRDLDERPPDERLRLREIRRASPAGGLSQPDPGSPIILLGDSHNLVFHAGDDMHAVGAGLPDQLSLELGVPVDLVAVRGSASTAARVNLFRRAQRDAAYWGGKRLLIWCFAAREFTEGDGWPIIPIRP